MNQVTIDALALLWDVITGLAVAAWVAVPFLLQKRAPWARSTLVSSLSYWQPRGIRGHRDIRRLIKTLNEIQGWLSNDEVPIWRSLKRRLWALTVQLNINEEAYFALRSQNADERIMALMHLSQADDIDEASRVIEGIIADKTTMDRVRCAAESVMHVLENRRKDVE